MSQQGGKPTGHEDDWWGQLYDDSTEDTGPTVAPDSLDDRFASAAGTVNKRGTPGRRAGADKAVPAQRPGTAEPSDATDRAGSVGSADSPPHPSTFPAGLPKPPGFTVAPPEGGAGEDPPAPAPGTEQRAQAGPTPPPLPPDAPAPPRYAPGAPSDAPAPPLHAPAAPSAAPAPPLDSPAPPVDAPPLPPTPPPPPTPAAAPPTVTHADVPTLPPHPLDYVGSGPPTYAAEPTALPPADPDDLDDLVADTVLDGARYGTCTLRAVSVRGDSARFRGEPRRDSLLTARFGTGEHALVLVAMATGARATPGAHRAAAEACHWIGRAVGRSHAKLAEDIRAARRGDLKSGLHRLTDRSLGKLRASAAEQGIEPEEYAATLRCLLLPADPECRTRVFFGVGAGGLFRLRDGEWQDIEPQAGEVTGEPVVGFGSPPAETPEGDRLTMDLGIPTPPSPYEPAPEPPREPFRFRASVARPGDTLLMCTSGLAEPLRGEPELSDYLTGRWSGPTPPGLAAFLADAQVRVKGYSDDRTAAAVWEA